MNIKPQIHITLDIAEQSMQRKAIVYDGTGDEHYDAASALIKSMRGSDPDAAVYWVARMLEAGEDPRFIARRIAILASEDIGNADPRRCHRCRRGIRHRRESRHARSAANTRAGSHLHGNRPQVQCLRAGDLGGDERRARRADSAGPKASARLALSRAPSELDWDMAKVISIRMILRVELFDKTTLVSIKLTMFQSIDRAMKAEIDEAI